MVVQVIEEVGVFERNIQFIRERGKHYWAKIAEFQLEYDGKNWRIVGEYDTGGHGFYEPCELCGFPRCRFKFIIENPETGQRLSIGDVCVVNYCKDINAKRILDKYRTKVTKVIWQLKRNQELYQRIVEWEQSEKGYSNGFISSIKAQLLRGKRLSKRQLKVLESVMSKEPKKMTDEEHEKVKELLGKAYVYSKLWSDWEIRFIDGIEERLKRRIPLTEKQMKTFERISSHYNKEDLETREKLNFIIESRIQVWAPVAKILIDMYQRRVSRFSPKQRALIENITI
jgi:hypothetical protein